jgi:uncharacterized ParB-like nuclease family protein
MDIEKAINDDYQALFYPEPMRDMTDAEPEALPMESPAGSQTVTPAEFGMDMGNLVKGVVTGAAGLTGDVLAIGRGLFEIGRRGGDETKLDAFLGGMEAGTFVPTTENINQWIDENVGLPERMKGASTTGFIGEVVAPGGALAKTVKGVAKGVKKAKKVVQVSGKSIDIVNKPEKGAKLVSIPIDQIEHGESAMPGGKLTWPGAKDLISDYASKKTELPPIDVVSNDSEMIAEGSPAWMIVDGSHRLEAAKLRGQKTIKAYVSPNDEDGLKIAEELKK